MSIRLLTFLVLMPTAAVVVAVFVVMWRERTSVRESAVAAVSGGVLAAWAVVTTVLASRGFFLQSDQGSGIPPVGINLVVVLGVLAASLIAAPTLRRLLSNQQNLIRLNLWRLLGVVFLIQTRHDDQSRTGTSLPHHADVRVGHALSARAGADLPRAARFHASCSFVVAAARWRVGDFI